MEYVVYILYSKKFDKHYTGYTSYLIFRFHAHNSLATIGWTIRYRPWRVVYVEFFHEKSEAIKHEKFLKTGKGREFFKDNTLPQFKLFL